MSGADRPIWDRLREAGEVLGEATDIRRGRSRGSEPRPTSLWRACDLRALAFELQAEAVVESDRQKLARDIGLCMLGSIRSSARIEDHVDALLERFDITPKAAS